jgi:hypothetical protein
MFLDLQPAAMKIVPPFRASSVEYDTWRRFCLDELLANFDCSSF